MEKNNNPNLSEERTADTAGLSKAPGPLHLSVTSVAMLGACCHSSSTANARTGKLPIPFTRGGTA